MAKKGVKIIVKKFGDGNQVLKGEHAIVLTFKPGKNKEGHVTMMVDGWQTEYNDVRLMKGAEHLLQQVKTYANEELLRKRAIVGLGEMAKFDELRVKDLEKQAFDSTIVKPAPGGLVIPGQKVTEVGSPEFNALIKNSK